jgi:hypothetical protein
VRSGAAVILAAAAAAWGQTPDVREIVRRSVERDQINWRHLRDYTWTARDVERRLDSSGKVKSERVDSWETLDLYGELYRRYVLRDNKPVGPDEQRKMDQRATKLSRETPEQRQRRVQQADRDIQKTFEFLREVPDIYNARLEGEDTIDGRAVWVVSGVPKAGYQAKSREARALTKVRGRVWIDKADYQWVKVEAETTDTISFGVFLARLNPGAKLVFEEERVNQEVWLPKRIRMSGAGRIGLVKKIVSEEEITYGNYRKFSAESKIVQ